MKNILMIAVVAAVFGGCAGTQENIDTYIKTRDKVVRSAKVVKCEKDCVTNCNNISNLIDRVDCKTSCIEYCHEI